MATEQELGAVPTKNVEIEHMFLQARDADNCLIKTFRLTPANMPVFDRKEVEMLGEVLWVFMKQEPNERLMLAAKHWWERIEAAYFNEFLRHIPNTRTEI